MRMLMFFALTQPVVFGEGTEDARGVAEAVGCRVGVWEAGGGGAGGDGVGGGEVVAEGGVRAGVRVEGGGGGGGGVSIHSGEDCFGRFRFRVLELMVGALPCLALP